MNNIDFLTKILTSTDEYWIVAKKYPYLENEKDSIILTCIPYSIKRGLNRDEILLLDLEKLEMSEMMNVHINKQYAPFQTDIGFNNVYDGYPIHTNVKEFMIKALQLKSDQLYDYKKLAIESTEPTN